MTNLNAIVENDFAKHALLDSERARGKNMDEVDYKMREIAFLVPRIRYLKKSARGAYSLALKAGPNKQERERYRSIAQDINNELEICVSRYNKLQDSFGNVIHEGHFGLDVCNNEATWVAMLARLKPRMFSTSQIVLVAKMQDQLLQSFLLTSATYNEANVPKSVVKLPLCMWTSKNHFALLEFRYVFDSNKQLDDDAFEFVTKTVENSFPSSENFLKRKTATPQKLLQSACASWVLTGKLDGRIYARISMERDFVTRQLDVRIEKRVRAKLAVSPYPSSIFVEIFEFVDESKGVKSLEKVDYQSNNNNKDMTQDRIRVAIENKQLDLFFEMAEDNLGSKSYLSGHLQSGIDELAFKLLRNDDTWKTQKPSVQYPCIHRWFRSMSRATFQ